MAVRRRTKRTTRGEGGDAGPQRLALTALWSMGVFGFGLGIGAHGTTRAVERALVQCSDVVADVERTDAEVCADRMSRVERACECTL